MEAGHSAGGGTSASYAGAAAKPVDIPIGNHQKGINGHAAHQPHSENSVNRRPKTTSAPTTRNAAHGRVTNVSKDGDDGPSGREATSGFGQKLQWLSGSLEARLSKLSNQPGWAGGMARRLLTHGHWVEEHVEEEWTLRRDAIGGIDNMWILLSSVAHFNPVCTATFVLRGKVEPKQLEKVIERQVEIFPRYKQVLRNTGRRFHGSTFENDPNWDVKRHISTTSLPGAAGNRELDELTAKLIASDWDYDKPLWNMVIVNNYKGDGLDGSCIITRGHHTLTDGQGFIMSQLYISSYGEELQARITDGRATISSARRGTAQPSKLHKGLKPLDRFQDTLLLQIVMFALFWLVAFASSVLEFLGGFKQGFSFAMHFLTDGWRARLLTSAYEGPRVREREFATSRAVPMSDVRVLQRAFSGPVPGGWVSKALGRKQVSWWGHLTLNDIFCTVLADIMADELEHQEEVRLPGIRSKIKSIANAILPSHIALMIPISIRPVANWEMRNWSTGSVVWLPMPDSGRKKRHGLPLGAKAMHARLHDISARLKVLKNSMLPTLTFWSVQLTGQAPLLFPSALWVPVRSVVRIFLELVLTSFTAVVTNVPGPTSKDGIEFAEAEVVRWAASPPQAGKGTLGIGIISYADGICITIAADNVPGSPSEGVAHRLTNKFAARWQQYMDTADEILARRGVSRDVSSSNGVATEGSGSSEKTH